MRVVPVPAAPGAIVTRSVAGTGKVAVPALAAPALIVTWSEEEIGQVAALAAPALIVTRSEEEIVEVAVPASASAPAAHVAAMSRSVGGIDELVIPVLDHAAPEGRDTEADHDLRTAPDVIAGPGLILTPHGMTVLPLHDIDHAQGDARDDPRREEEMRNVHHQGEAGRGDRRQRGHLLCES